MPPDFCMDCGIDWSEHGRGLDGSPTCPDGGMPWEWLFEMDREESA